MRSIIIATIIAAVSARALNSSLVARDECLDIDSNKPPVSFYGSAYFRPVAACSPKYALKDGSCEAHISVKNTCRAYCETHRFWFFGKPQAINSGNNCLPGECTQVESYSFSVTKQWSIQAGVTGKEILKAAFNLGATWGEGYTTLTGTSTSRGRADTSTCGSWYIIPIYEASCGVVSYRKFSKSVIPNPFGPPTYKEKCEGDVTTVKKVCDVTPMKDSKGNPKHQTAFVVKDCATRDFLGPEKQPAEFNEAVDWAEYYENQVRWSNI